jgi:large subunit ribosomal protein L3
MAGHMGVAKNTVKNLKIVVVDIENNLLAVSGAVPGHNDGLIEIQTV